MAVTTTLNVCTYNSRGHKPDRLSFIEKLMHECHVMFVQEHWYLQRDIFQLCKNIPFIDIVGTSGMDDTTLLTGRPYGGCAILYHKDLNWSVTTIDAESKRICACICNDPRGFRVLMVNLYMPCDTTGSRPEFCVVLDEVSRIITDHSDIEYVIVGGDLNTDVSRLRSCHSSAIREFCADHSMRLCVDHSVSNVNFTYFNEHSNVRSLLDHFIVTDNLFNMLSGYSSVDDIDNFSDHNPVMLSLNLASRVMVERQVQLGARPSWARASDHHVNRYKESLRERLAQIRIPNEVIECTNFHCDEHDEVIVRYYSEIINAMKTSAANCIPKFKKRAKAGWAEFVSPAREKSLFWHRIWVECGKPHDGWLNQVRLRAKAEYKRLSKWVIRNQERLVADRMAEKLSMDANRDFWSEVRKVRSTASSCTNVIDDAVGESDICDLLASKYEELYQSVSFNENEMDNLLYDVNTRVNNVCNVGRCYCNHRISCVEVIKAISKLKRNKPDADPDLSSDHYINAPNELYVHLSFLLSCMLSHQEVPQQALLSVLRPIPKNRKKSLNESSNYRSIAISSILLKVLDNVILFSHSHVLCTSDLQFGFKPKHSTTQCTFIVNEVVDYYTSGGSSVYVTLLDASKAFDKVNYVRLFTLLLKRGLCPLLIKFLLQMYTHQSLVVKWQGSSSQAFDCRNGIKQGAVLSPVLFCIYMDHLLVRLAKSGVGCYVGHIFSGAISYADDLTLLAPSHIATQSLLNICSNFAAEFDVTFNSSKSNIVVFNSSRNCEKRPLYLCESVIPYCSKAKHLGLFIGENVMKCNMKKATQDFVSQVNMLICNYSHCKFESLRYLFNSYCSSYYGCPLWDLSENSLSSFCTTWRKCIRRLFNLNNTTRSKYLPFLIECPDIKCQLYSRFAGFYYSCKNSTNSLVNICFEMPHSESSTFRKNVHCLANYLGVNQTHLNSMSVNRSLKSTVIKHWHASCDPTTIAEAHVIIDLINSRQQSVYIDYFDYSEIAELLNFVCTVRI